MREHIIDCFVVCWCLPRFVVEPYGTVVVHRDNWERFLDV